MTTRILQLYTADERGVVGSRICPLPDMRTATVRREVNGEYSLTASLPRGSLYENEIQIGRAIKATVNEAGNEQHFIIKRRTRTLTGDMSIYAEHQSYYYNGVIVNGNSANLNGQVRVVFAGLRSYAHPDITSITTWTYSRSTSLRANFPARPSPISLMEALKRFLIEAAGGELIFDGLNVEYVDAMGSDNGAFYRYGINLTDMSSEDILDNYASGIFPFWGSAGDATRPLTVLSGDGIVNFSGTFPLKVIAPVDFSEHFDTQPTEQELLAAAQEYAALNTPTGVPISVRASRVRIDGDVPVDLGDTVRIVNGPWGVDIKTRIYSLTFDALQGRVLDVEFGTVNPGFAGAVKNMK